MVQIAGEGSYQYTTESAKTDVIGNKEVTVKEIAVKMLDKQKQPKITAIK